MKPESDDAGVCSRIAHDVAAMTPVQVLRKTIRLEMARLDTQTRSPERGEG